MSEAPCTAHAETRAWCCCCRVLRSARRPIDGWDEQGGAEAGGAEEARFWTQPMANVEPPRLCPRRGLWPAASVVALYANGRNKGRAGRARRVASRSFRLQSGQQNRSAWISCVNLLYDAHTCTE